MNSEDDWIETSRVPFIMPINRQSFCLQRKIKKTEEKGKRKETKRGKRREEREKRKERKGKRQEEEKEERGKREQREILQERKFSEPHIL